MDFRRLRDQAKKVVDKRGGPESVKEDATELKDIFKGGGSFSDKAKAAADAVKEPGAPGADRPADGGASSRGDRPRQGGGDRA